VGRPQAGEDGLVFCQDGRVSLPCAQSDAEAFGLGSDQQRRATQHASVGALGREFQRVLSGILTVDS
jgi:hypothetical protein